MEDNSTGDDSTKPGGGKLPKPKGGARPGAGRPPKIPRDAVQEAKAAAETRSADELAEEIRRIEEAGAHVFTIAEIETRMASKLGRCVDLLMELAEGVEVQETDRRGETKTYTRPPDKDALRYILDRCLGRIPERVDMMPKTAEDEGAKGPTPRELLHKIVLMLLASQQQPGQPLTLPQIEEIVNA